MNWARAFVLAAWIGVLIGISGFGVSRGLWGGEETEAQPVYPSAVVSANGIGTNTQIPYWLGFYSRALWDRYPLYYCLDGAGWSQDDHNAANDGLATSWGWMKLNRTLAPQIQERCDEPPLVTVRFVMDSTFVQNYCQPNASFTVVACVSFDDWKWIGEANAWAYKTAIVHVEPYWWARSDHAWRELIIIHEFGHAGISLNDTPAQPCGVTAMDYTYEVACGMLPYPAAADIDVADTLHRPYKDPAWYRWLQAHP